ncbi:Zinc transporter ZupT [Defluviimonas aquaemixtae]|uniref:Zinc transporter ZupT n=1 Tax=Albidovulum aquaemixtae TaxID=1542388 RepID=A0A2R8B6F6_9RHOB|nr:metal transporter [Defluviimonas aquaemixtae]SPH18218.1 Zinc transporter ZupT [Defluviimonas aquaemixtae]
MRTAWLVLPVIVLAALVAFIIVGKPFDRLTRAAPAVEDLAVETVRLGAGLIEMSVRADGSIPIVIAQVQVDGAYRDFTLDPAGPIDRLARGTVRIPYPWVDGETHHILLLTSTGVGFEHTIDVAQNALALDGPTLWVLTLVGLLLGVAPVAAGMLAYPALRDAGPGVIHFLLALTIGLLAYLLIDTLREGLEAGAETLGRLRGETLVWVSAGLTTLALVAFGRRRGQPPEGIALAAFIALGIGLHNFGEGLVVGASFATGAAALAAFLVVGFVLHNVTEGIGIAAPLLRLRPSLQVFIALALLAGLPAVFGVWIGAQAINPYFVALCFGVGAGAILQVIIEVVGLTTRSDGAESLTRPAYAGGIATGLAVMYATALLV